MIPALDELHWLRPGWLWLLVALPVLAWWWQRRRRRGSVWQQAVDPHLLPHLLEARTAASGLAAAVVAATAFVLGVLALAGPSVRETRQPLWIQQAPLVVAVDLSSASRAADMAPSRIARARAKIASLLAARPDGQVGLVAWAGEAFTVAPLTPDTANVALFLDALDPEVMPVDGQRADRAIAWSVRLLAQAGFQHGTVLVLADSATPLAVAEAAKAQARGYTVSVLGMGSTAGAPYRNGDGLISTARRDDASLQRMAAAGGGRYAPMSEDPGDLAALALVGQGSAANGAAEGIEAGTTVTARQDAGYWLLLPLMGLALFAFRRGAPVLLVVMCLWLPGRGAHAAELWQRPDQRVHQTMMAAAEAYRRGDFAAAAAQYGGVGGAEADYNRGNALARAGRYAEALEAYDAALASSAGMADAIANRQAVAAAMKRQPPAGPADGRSGEGKSARPPGDDGDPRDGEDGSSGGAAGNASPDARDSGSSRQPPTGGQAPPPAPAGPDDANSSDDAKGASAPPPGRSEGSRPPDNAAPPPPAGQSPQSAAAAAKAQQAADAAQRQRMREALQQGGKDSPEAGQADAVGDVRESGEERERRMANEAWLRRIPDDPGGLLRRKFQIEYERRQREGSTP